MRQLFLLTTTLIILIMTACTAEPSATIIELDGAIPSVTPRIVYVTPTREPSPFPTVAIATQVPTLASISASATPEAVAVIEDTTCTAILETLYTQASEACIGEPSGFFCNGGLAPSAEATGNVSNVSNTMAIPGSLVPVNVVGSVHTPALLTNDSGGLMWVRLDSPINANALLLGDVELRDITPVGNNLTEWQSMSVITRDASLENRTCSSEPYSTFVIQGPWGSATNFAVNGVSIELTGSIAIQTRNLQTSFIVLEGQVIANVFGQSRLIIAGQQLNVDYANDSFTQPAGVPPEATILEFDRIANIPIPLLDRPLLLPQPGFARTDGNVNMRAEDSVNSQLLAEVPNDQIVSIIGMNLERTWYHVRLPNGENGWMRADLVTGDIGEITVVYGDIPLPPERFGDSSHSAVVISASGANLREAPDVQFSVIDTLPAETEVQIIARSPYSPFVKVETPSGTGWIALITIETTTVIQFLPIDYDVPLPPGPTPTPYFAFGGGHAYPDPRSGN
ncbi:MAG: hypothetical protein Phog2KO_36970 [Phototrophicaceae bacterium]